MLWGNDQGGRGRTSKRRDRRSSFGREQESSLNRFSGNSAQPKTGTGRGILAVVEAQSNAENVGGGRKAAAADGERARV